MRNYQTQMCREEEQVRLGSIEMESEAGIDGKAARLLYLTETQSDLQDEREKYRNVYGQHIVADTPYMKRWFVMRKIEHLDTVIDGIRREVSQVAGFSDRLEDGFTREEIERAKGYPVDQIIEVDKHGKALCLDHNDTRPSMYCRGDFVYCFSCGYKADHIGVMMRVNDIGFQEAVRRMM